MRIGIAISVYNKAAEVATNINLIRKHWKHKDVFISVCCNHPETYEKLKSLEIDSLVEGINYPVFQKSDLRLRQYDCIKKSVTSAAKNSDYVFHWHSDAYCLDSDTLISIIEDMNKNNSLIAARGVWKDYKSFRGPNKAPNGEVDDHFFCIDSSHLIDSGMYNNDDQVQYIKEISGIYCSEGILATLMQNVTPLEKIHIYSNMSECEVSPDIINDSRFFYNDDIPHRTLCPFNLDRKRMLLHSDDITHTKRFFSQLNVPNSLICESL
jgi:hypothetical protein